MIPQEIKSANTFFDFFLLDQQKTSVYNYTLDTHLKCYYKRYYG